MNSFVDLIAYWLADYYLTTTVLLAVALVAIRCCRQPVKRLAVTKATMVAMFAMAGLCALPGWSVVSLGKPEAAEGTVAESSEIVTVPEKLPLRPAIVVETREPMAKALPSPIAVEAQQELASPPIDWSTVLVETYLFGAVAMALWLVVGVLAARRLVRRAERAPNQLSDLLRLASDSHRASPDLMVSDEIDVAVALGLFRPRVLLPRRWVSSRTRDELHTVLAHEAAHLDNGDLKWLAASRLLLVLLWAQPLYWWLRGIFRLDQETLADAATAERAGRQQYAEQLIAWARDVGRRPRPLLPASVGLWEGASQLRRRVAVLLDERFAVLQRCPTRWRRGAGLLAVLAAIFLSLVTNEPGRSEPGQSAPIASADQELSDEDALKVAKAIVVLQEMEGFSDRQIGIQVADTWAKAIRTLAEIGSPAVPPVIEALDAESRDHAISKLAFALRAMGDPRALLPSRSDYGLQMADDELLRFMRDHDIEEKDVGYDDTFTYGRAFREVVGALHKLTGANQDDMELNWVRLGETESQRRIQRKLFHDLAERWADWWAKNWQRLGVDVRYAAVDLPPLDAGDAIAKVSSLPTGSKLALGEPRSEWVVQSAHESERRCFVDLDTAREAGWPAELPRLEEGEEGSDEMLAWARKQGFDLVGFTYRLPGTETPLYCLLPIDLQAWEITPEEQRDLPRAMRGEIPYPLGKPVVRLVPRGETYEGPDKKDLGGTAFLFLTREGTAGLLRMTTQVTDTNVRVGSVHCDEDQYSPIGFYHGAKISFAVMVEMDSAAIGSEEQKSDAAERANAENASSTASPAPNASEADEAVEGDGLGGASAANEIVGVVLDEAGQAVPDVTVDAWTWYPGNETQTDEKGRFRLKGFDPREPVELQFTKSGFCPRLFIAQPVGKADWVVTLNNRSYLEGRVLDPDGKPIAGIDIRATRGPFDVPDGSMIAAVWTETETGADGHYRMYLEPGTYELRVRQPGVGVARYENTVVRENDRREFDLQLESGPVFRARVIDSQSGEPVAGIRLFKWREPGIVGSSTNNGELKIANMLPGQYEFNVSANIEKSKFPHVAGEYARWWSPDAIKAWQRLDLTDRGEGFQRNFDGLEFDVREGMEPITIVVERGVKIRGLVVDPDGKPVAGATVAAAKTGSGNSLTGDTRYSVRTTADGTFAMRLPASGAAKYNLVAHDGDYEEWRTWANGIGELMQTKPGDVVENVKLQLSRPCVVRGRVEDASGQPVAKHRVRAQAADKRESRYYDPTTETNERGEFELRFVRPGKHYIQAEPFWLTAEQGPKSAWRIVEANPDRPVEGVELRLEPTGGTSPLGAFLMELREKSAEKD